MPARRRLRGVAVVVHNFDAAAGMERQARLLASRLHALGLAVTVVTTDAVTDRRARDGHARATPAGLDVIRVPRVAWWPYEATLRLVDLVLAWTLARRRARASVTYAVQYTSARHARNAARVVPAPVVVKFAGGGAPGDLSRMRSDMTEEQRRALLRSMDRYVCISTQIEEEVRAERVAPERILRIRNGVDVSRFAGCARAKETAPPSDRSGGERTILWVGRLSEEKRPDVLLRAMPSVLARVPDARLVVAGSGPLDEACRARARALGVAERVSFVGETKDVVGLHARASVYVLPSASEGISNSLLEALAAGTPVVATRIPGTEEVVAHEREALLVPRDDPAALADALARVLTDEPLARRLAAAGRARVAAEFDIDAVARAYVATFRELAPRAPLPVHADELFRLALAFLAVLVPFLVGIARERAGTVARALVTAVVVAAKAIMGR